MKPRNLRPGSTKLFGALLLAILVAVVSVSGSENEYLRSLRDDFLDNADVPVNDTGACKPNAAKDGIVCENVVLAQTNVLNNELVLTTNISITFDKSSQEFHYLGGVYVSYGNIQDVSVAKINFTSATPDGANISQGSVPLGPVVLPLRTAVIPDIPLMMDVIHNITLSRNIGNNNSSSCDNSNGSVCDEGVLHGNFGILASGSSSNALLKVTVNVSEPNAANFDFAFRSRADDSVICETLGYSIQANPGLVAHVEICPSVLPCFSDDRHFDLPGVNRTLADGLCFQPSTSSNSTSSM